MAFDDSTVNISMIPTPEEINRPPIAGRRDLLLQYKQRILQLLALYKNELRPRQLLALYKNGWNATFMEGDLAGGGSIAKRMILDGENWRKLKETDGFRKDALTVEEMIPGPEIGVYPKVLKLCQSLAAINVQLKELEAATTDRARQKQFSRDADSDQAEPYVKLYNSLIDALEAMVNAYKQRTSHRADDIRQGAKTISSIVASKDKYSYWDKMIEYGKRMWPTDAVRIKAGL